MKPDTETNDRGISFTKTQMGLLFNDTMLMVDQIEDGCVSGGQVNTPRECQIGEDRAVSSPATWGGGLGSGGSLA